MRSLEEGIKIEQMARALAGGAGVIWDGLDHYPGYLRGIWGARAAELLREMIRNQGLA